MAMRPVTLGGAFCEPKVHSAQFEEAYKDLGYIWIDVPGKGQLQIFVNFESGLFVADMTKGDGGVEFVRTIMPKVKPLTKAQRASLAFSPEEDEWAAGD